MSGFKAVQPKRFVRGHTEPRVRVFRGRAEQRERRVEEE